MSLDEFVPGQEGIPCNARGITVARLMGPLDLPAAPLCPTHHKLADGCLLRSTLVCALPRHGPVRSRRTRPHPKKRTTVHLRGDDEGLPPKRGAAERKQHWHQGVTLLASFTLGNVMGDTVITLPQVNGRRAVELPLDERNDV